MSFLDIINNMPLWKSAFLLATIIIIISLVATGKTWLSLLFFIIAFILICYILTDIGWIKAPPRGWSLIGL